MERGDELFEQNLNELHERRYDENKHYRLEICESVWLENVILKRVCHGGCHEHYKGNRNAHAYRGIELFGNSEEGANAEEAAEDVVIYEHGAHEDNYKRLEIHYCLSSFTSAQPPWHVAAVGQPAHENSFFFIALPFVALFTMAIIMP